MLLQRLFARTNLNIKSEADRHSRAISLNESRNKINKKFVERLNELDKAKLEEADKALNTGFLDRKGTSTSVGDVQKRAAERLKDINDWRKMEYEAVQESFPEAVRLEKANKKKEVLGRLKDQRIKAEKEAKEAKGFKISTVKDNVKKGADFIKKHKKAGYITLGATALAGVGYGGKKLYDKRQENKKAEGVRRRFKEKD